MRCPPIWWTPHASEQSKAKGAQKIALTPLLRTCRSRSGADRQRGASTYRRALRHRRSDPWPDARPAMRRAPGTQPADHRRLAAMAPGKTLVAKPENQTGGGHPLRTLALGRPDALHQRRAHRDRLEHSRTPHQAHCAQPQERAFRRIRCRR